MSAGKLLAAIKLLSPAVASPAEDGDELTPEGCMALSFNGHDCAALVVERMDDEGAPPTGFAAALVTLIEAAPIMAELIEAATAVRKSVTLRQEREANERLDVVLARIGGGH